MTVVAGVSLFNGVMLIADSRVTVSSHGRPNVYCDLAQKIFPLTQTTALGFSGDLRTASLIMRELLKQIRRRPRRDSVSLLHWLPRFISATYRALQTKNQQPHPVRFLVGSVIPDHINVIERQKVVDILQTIASGNTRIQRNWLPEIVVRVLQTPATAKLVTIPGTVRGLLYTMSPPHFRPRHMNPLEAQLAPVKKLQLKSHEALIGYSQGNREMIS
jgi:hypothetical protein